MAQSGYTPIVIYNSSTTGNVPSSANLATGELAINTADGKLFYKNSGGTVVSFASGALVSNDTTTATNEYPLFANATSGNPSTIYTSSPNYLYKPSTGELQAPEVIANNGLLLNKATVSASYTIATGNNAMSVGPVSVASGQSVTVSSGQRWVIL